MSSFGKFIESEAFFPILLIILLILIGVFVYIVFSNKKKEQMYKEQLDNAPIDESAQIKIIGGDDQNKNGETEITNENNNIEQNSEIRIVEKDKDDNIFDNKDLAMQEYKKSMQTNNDEKINVPGLFQDEVEKGDELELPVAKQEIEVKEEKPMSEEDKKIMEAFSLPDLSNTISDKSLEDEIIKAANEYIANIMKSGEEDEKN